MSNNEDELSSEDAGDAGDTDNESSDDRDELIKGLLQRVKELELENETLKAEKGLSDARQVPFSIASDVKKYISRSKTEELQKLVQDKKITANDRLLLEQGESFGENDIREQGIMSLLEYAALLGEYEVCSLLINLGATPDEELFTKVVNRGYFHIAVLLSSMELKGAGGSEAADISQRLDRQNGIIKEMLRSIKETSSGNDENLKTFIHIIEKNIVNCIEKEVGFSDDLLNTLYFYYTKIENKPFIDTDLFTVINKKCKEIIENKKIKNWYFFKTYILSSTVWMRDAKAVGWEDYFDTNDDVKDDKKDADENAFLFYELLSIVNDGFEDKICKKLQEPFKEIAEENADDWKQLCGYDIESTLESSCRQDLVPNGVKADYSFNELTKYVPSSASFNAYSHYDVNEYLSKLVLTAHTVDNEFHKSIQMIFEIDLQQNNQSSIKELNNMEYQRGPIKLISRCKAKAETDYANETYPSSACILDINRCALIFNDINSLLKGLDLFQNKICYFQSGNIVAICRDKNGFAVYSHDKPDYADIKFNVLIKGVKYNVIGEVQFMLRQMMNFKHSVHSLYSIIRRKEFVDDFIKILPIKNDPAMRMKSAASMVDYNVLSDLMVTHGFHAKQLLAPVNQKGATILALIFKNLHIKSKEKAAVRCFKLLLENISKEIITDKLLKMSDGFFGDDGWRALGHYEMTQLLFKEIPQYHELMKKEKFIESACCTTLSYYPEPQQFINLINILNVDKKLIDKWIRNPAFVFIPLENGHEDNVKYIFSLFPSQLEVFKFLNNVNEDDESSVSLLQTVCLSGVKLKTLLMSFDAKHRLKLIEDGELILFNVTMISTGYDIFQTFDVIKMIIQSIDELPEQQYRILTEEYAGFTLSDLADTLEAPIFANWVQKKFNSLKTTQSKQ